MWNKQIKIEMYKFKRDMNNDHIYVHEDEGATWAKKP